MASIDLLGNRVDFKLHASQTHLDRFRALITPAGSLAASTPVRVEAELDLDEFFYELLSTKESLLQEVNTRMSLGLLPHHVNQSNVNKELARINRLDVLADMNQITNATSWLALVNELHNHSEHRALISKSIYAATNPADVQESLIDPRTRIEIPMQIIDYLEQSLTEMRDLVRATRARLP